MDVNEKDDGNDWVIKKSKGHLLFKMDFILFNIWILFLSV